MATARSKSAGTARSKSAGTAQRDGRDTAQRALDTAERLVRVRGFNAFSYADVAAALGVTTASLHYHFPGKSQLGEALVARYADRFAGALEQIDADQPPAPAKLEAYASLYAQALRGKRMCLCGMLAADYETLPKPIRQQVITFFDENEAWLARVLEQGRAEGTLRFERSAADTARMIIGGLEGAMLVARPYGDIERFQSAASTLLQSLKS